MTQTKTALSEDMSMRNYFLENFDTIFGLVKMAVVFAVACNFDKLGGF